MVAILHESDAIKDSMPGAAALGAQKRWLPRRTRERTWPTHPAAKDFLEYDNPYNVGMTGISGGGAGYRACTRTVDVL